MKGIKKEYEEWDRFVDDIKKKKLEEVFYTIKAVVPRENENVMQVFAIFSALNEFKDARDGMNKVHIYTHTAFLSSFDKNMPQKELVASTNSIVDENFIKDLQRISVPIIIRGQISEF